MAGTIGVFFAVNKIQNNLIIIIMISFITFMYTALLQHNIYVCISIFI